MIKSKKQMFLVITIFTLVMMLGTISYAFFNYTRTGSTNNVRVGRVNFSSSQNNTINLTNVFPTDSSHLDNTNSSTVTINITGDTNYSEGIEYKVSLVEVNNIVSGKEVPIGYSVTASSLGDKSSDYYNERGSTTNVYNLRESGIAEEGQDIVIGYIKPDENGINGSINITAFIDADGVGISDTVSRIVNDNLVYGETDAEWIAGRTILTTEEWNSLATNGISFKVKVEANEGLWVTEPTYLVLNRIGTITDWKNIKAKVTSIEFSTNTEIPANAIATIDASDVTSAGPVTIYTVDDGKGNNTYKAVICADGDIYAPTNSRALFSSMPLLESITGNNFKTDNVTNMYVMFGSSSSLTNINFALNWNTSKVTNMSMMFFESTNLSDISGMRNWDTSNVETLENLFYKCSNIQNADALLNWNTSKVENIKGLFASCSSLDNINGLINWDTSKVTDMSGAFTYCTSLQNADGVLNWNTSLVTNMSNMFSGCSSIARIDLSNFDMSRVANDRIMFQEAGFTTLTMPNNYTRIDNFMFNHNEYYTGTSFTIPRSVTYVGNSHIFYDFGLDDVFEKFIVESGSTSLKTIDDILYTYDGTRLISIPRGKTFTNNTFEIPEGVTFLNELSFSRNLNIDKVIIPNSYIIERFIDENNNNYGFINSGSSLNVAIYQFTSVKRYEVKNDNTRYMSYEGCIYSKDGTELIAIPLHYTGVLNIKAGTTTIGQEAFETFSDIKRVDNITQINIPASVTTIEANQLTRLNALMSRSTNPVTITIDSGNTAYQIVNNQIVAR